MLIFDRLNDSRKFLLALDLLKISFIIFISFSLMAQIVSYYEGFDSYIYGNTAINLAENGIYSYITLQTLSNAKASCISS